ncbi:hypothetical protein B9G98_02383 [Wickerhamiella sorbophila]|uniref:Uncharacterized protein n=1 Tax=Wickerhamiella sorbophila TaxID=45607 RepID=A0A2T0FID9_9ASCO|nr:hypothetical protein B9G98_02383 [Wickerhamiella sorbophila]PRT54763.1 hypothetical protein B9G98_02383 [Wickerhamiella sorbophila]
MRHTSIVFAATLTTSCFADTSPVTPIPPSGGVTLSVNTSFSATTATSFITVTNSSSSWFAGYSSSVAASSNGSSPSAVVSFLTEGLSSTVNASSTEGLLSGVSSAGNYSSVAATSVEVASVTATPYVTAVSSNDVLSAEDSSSAETSSAEGSLPLTVVPSTKGSNFVSFTSPGTASSSNNVIISANVSSAAAVTSTGISISASVGLSAESFSSVTGAPSTKGNSSVSNAFPTTFTSSANDYSTFVAVSSVQRVSPVTLASSAEVSSTESSLSATFATSTTTSLSVNISSLAEMSTPSAIVTPSQASAKSIASGNVRALWETRTLPEISCSAPVQTVFSDWISAIGKAADSVNTHVREGVLPSAAAAVGSLVCEFRNVPGNATKFNAHDNLAAYSAVNARVAIALAELSTKVDTLHEGTDPARLQARALVTLQNYVQNYISGALSFEMVMSAAVEFDTTCSDRISFSSDVDVMSSAFNIAGLVFSLYIYEMTAPTLCTSQLIPTSASANAPTVCSKTESAVTTVVTAYTTYCPEPTTICHNGFCHTVTKATTLTITDCPCTITSIPLVVPTAKPGSKTTSTKPVAPVSESPDVVSTLVVSDNVVPANGAISFSTSMFLTVIGVLAALF